MNVLTTIVAVVGLVLILFGAWKLYSIYANQEDANAKKIIGSVDGRISDLSAGEYSKLVIMGQENWKLIGWSILDPLRPEQCWFKSCVCICKIMENDYDYSNYAKSCSEKGFCRFYGDEQVDVFTLYDGETRHITEEELMQFMKQVSIKTSKDKFYLFQKASTTSQVAQFVPFVYLVNFIGKTTNFNYDNYNPTYHFVSTPTAQTNSQTYSYSNGIKLISTQLYETYEYRDKDKIIVVNLLPSFSNEFLEYSSDDVANAILSTKTVNPQIKTT